MYDLAPRRCELGARKPDNDYISPQYYYVSDYSCPRRSNEGNAPFNSMDRRFRTKKGISGPSPNKYFPKYRKYRIKGGKSLQFTTPRICMIPKKKDSSLNSISPLVSPEIHNFFQTTETSFIVNNEKKEKHFLKELYACHDKGPGLENLHENVRAILQSVESSKSLSEYLRFAGEINKTSLKYKGSRWSQYKSKRNLVLITSESPGPAAYNTTITEPIKKQREITVKKLKKFHSSCPPLNDEEKPISLSNQIDDKIYDARCDYLYKKKSYNKNPLGIWPKAKRTLCEINSNPAPADYNPCVELKCSVIKKKQTPFNSMTPRFVPPKRTDLSPASYFVIYKSIQEKFLKTMEKRKQIKVTPVRLQTQHFQPKIEHDFYKDYISVTPCCASDEENNETEYSLDSCSSVSINKTRENYPSDELNNCYNNAVEGTSLVLCNFQSQDKPTNKTEVPSNYFLKKCHRKPIGNEGFLSTNYEGRNWIINTSPSHNVDWMPMTDMKISGGPKMNTPVHSKNLEQKDNSVFYNVHPMYSSSVYKSTHNIRLKRESSSKKCSRRKKCCKPILKYMMPKEFF